MADILITHSYFLRFDPKQWKLQRPYAPLATLYAAAVLDNAGFDIDFYDVMFAETADKIEDVIKECQPKILVIYDDGFNYLTKMCLTNMREAAFKMSKIAKRYGCRVIISSSDSTDHYRKYIEEGVDFVIHGEGEKTLLELCNFLLKNELDIANIKGISYLERNGVVQNPARENQKNLDIIPFPAWHLINLNEYRNRWLKSTGYFSINIGTTRGCPFKCNWCAKPIYGNRYNSRSPQNVVTELKMLKEKYQFDHVWFCDDIFGLKPGWVNQFADLIQKDNLVIRFKIQSRADLLLEENNIDALARAGCDEAWVGAESGSQKILDAMDKGIKVEEIYQATRLMQRKGIKPCFFLQFGYPGETNKEIEATMQMVFELMPHDLGISVSYPLPGTKFYEQVKSQLSYKTNWSDSDELLMMFQSTYPPVFYKKLQRHVHYEFRKRQAWEALKNLHHLKDLQKACTLGFRIPQSIISKAVIKKYVG
jgi:radical SAM superfamily enzyme YgiQ (UPF0313 family)